MTDQTYGVYVVLLGSGVLKHKRYTARSSEYDPDLPCYYVGMTGLTPEERFENHKKGHNSSKYVKKSASVLFLNCMNLSPDSQQARKLKQKRKSWQSTIEKNDMRLTGTGTITMRRNPQWTVKRLP